MKLNQLLRKTLALTMVGIFFLLVLADTSSASAQYYVTFHARNSNWQGYGEFDGKVYYVKDSQNRIRVTSVYFNYLNAGVTGAAALKTSVSVMLWTSSNVVAKKGSVDYYEIGKAISTEPFSVGFSVGYYSTIYISIWQSTYAAYVIPNVPIIKFAGWVLAAPGAYIDSSNGPITIGNQGGCAPHPVTCGTM